MAREKVFFGSVGPLYYHDDTLLPDGSGNFQSAIDGNHGRIGALLSVTINVGTINISAGIGIADDALLEFGDDDDFALAYDSGTDDFQIRTGATDLLTLDKSGNLDLVLGGLDVTGNAVFDGDVTTIGTLFVASAIEHLGDSDTKIQYTTDGIRLEAGGNRGITIGAGNVTIGTLAEDVNFLVNDAAAAEIFRVDAGTGDVTVVNDFEVGGDAIIGSTSVVPDGTLHVFTASAGAVTAAANADDLIVENSANAGISILGGAGQEASLLFGIDTDNRKAGVIWITADNTFNVGTSVVGAELLLGSGEGVVALTIDENQALFFASGAGMQYGQIWVRDNTSVTTFTGSGVANKSQFVLFDGDGPSNGSVVSDQANSHVTVGKDGDYDIVCYISALSTAGPARTISFDLYKNDGATFLNPCHEHRILDGGGGDIGSITIGGLVTLSAGDTVELWVHNETGSESVILEDVVLKVAPQLGG